MKLLINGCKIKFKKSDTVKVFNWLSSVVHIAAPYFKHGEVAALPEPEALEILVPDFVSVIDPDGEQLDDSFYIPSECYAELKLARRSLAPVKVEFTTAVHGRGHRHIVSGTRKDVTRFLRKAIKAADQKDGVDVDIPESVSVTVNDGFPQQTNGLFVFACEVPAMREALEQLQ